MLFQRKGNRLILTPAGRELVSDFTSAATQMQNAIERAHRTQRVEGEHPRIVGVYDQLDPDKIILPGTKNYQKTYPEFACIYEFYPVSDLPQKLLSGEVDSVVAPLYEEETYRRIKDIAYQVTSRFSLCVDVSMEHPLAKYETISFDMLKPYPFVVPSPSLKTGMEEKLILPLCAKYGFTPQIGHYASTINGLTYFNSQYSVAISNQQHFLAEDKKRIRIRDEETGLLLAWKKDSPLHDDELLAYVIEYWKIAE